MKTLDELIIEAKCRKGPSAATTASGAYWLACPPIPVAAGGGDGIGQSAASWESFLELRHFRDGHVTVCVVTRSFHQNGSRQELLTLALNDAQTAEDVIVTLKADGSVDTFCEDDAIAALVAFGLPEALPAPDETPDT